MKFVKIFLVMATLGFLGCQNPGSELSDKEMRVSEVYDDVSLLPVNVVSISNRLIGVQGGTLTVFDKTTGSITDLRRFGSDVVQLMKSGDLVTLVSAGQVYKYDPNRKVLEASLDLQGASFAGLSGPHVLRISDSGLVRTAVDDPSNEEALPIENLEVMDAVVKDDKIFAVGKDKTSAEIYLGEPIYQEVNTKFSMAHKVLVPPNKRISLTRRHGLVEATVVYLLSNKTGYFYHVRSTWFKAKANEFLRSGTFIDIGTPESFEAAQHILKV